jgi:hypothetical protein
VLAASQQFFNSLPTPQHADEAEEINIALFKSFCSVKVRKE